MARIGMVLHEQDPGALRHAQTLAHLLVGQGHRVVVLGGDASATSAVSDADVDLVEADDFANDLDLAVSFGGDGTMLRTVGLLAGADVKILGVNFGDLGYLTVVEPGELEAAVARCLCGDHDVEQRMLLRGTIGSTTVHALNDIVVERSPAVTTVRIGVSIDGRRFTSYSADGLIVATPTGSTAYALSARGPVVAPTHSSIQITPVSPHMLFDRTLVLESESEVALTVEGHRSAVVSVDGNTMLTMEPGDTLMCSQSERVANLVTFGERDHLAVLISKLGLADP